MKKPMSKKQRKKLFSRKPYNLAFWRWTVSSREDMIAFFERGDERQIKCIVRTLNYLKKYEKELFEKINGEENLEKFKKKAEGFEGEIL